MEVIAGYSAEPSVTTVKGPEVVAVAPFPVIVCLRGITKCYKLNHLRKEKAQCNVHYQEGYNTALTILLIVSISTSEDEEEIAIQRGVFGGRVEAPQLAAVM